MLVSCPFYMQNAKCIEVLHGPALLIQSNARTHIHHTHTHRHTRTHARTQKHKHKQTNKQTTHLCCISKEIRLMRRDREHGNERLIRPVVRHVETLGLSPCVRTKYVSHFRVEATNSRMHSNAAYSTNLISNTHTHTHTHTHFT